MAIAARTAAAAAAAAAGRRCAARAGEARVISMPRGTRALHVSGAAAGLYGVPELSSPAGFDALAERAEALARDVLSHAMLPSAAEGDSACPLAPLDALSDAVCQVADAAELCRNTHADAEWRQAADGAWRRLGALIYAVNSDQALYASIKRAERRHEALERERALGLAEANALAADVDGWRASEPLVVLRGYLHEMESGGVHLSGTPAGTRHAVACRDADRLAHAFAAAAGGGGGGGAAAATAALQRLPDAAARKQVYLAGARAGRENLDVLVDLLQARHAMAAELGYASFAHATAAPLMARSPETIAELLVEFETAIAPWAEEEDELLRQSARLPAGARVAPWDRPFFEARRSEAAYTSAQQRRRHTNVAVDVSEYMRLPSVLQGLSELLTRLFGITLQRVGMGECEAWAKGVSKHALVCPEEGVLGYVYLDLLARAHKRAVTATHVVRAGREDPSMPGGYRVATVALVMNVGGVYAHEEADPLLSSAGVSLSHGQLTTLLHEFGHVLHALLSRTRYQSVSGIRCAHDYVELPSTVFEHLASDREALKLLARHSTTREPLPDEAIDGLLAASDVAPASALAQKRAFAAFDQRLHSCSPPPTSAQDTIDAHAGVYTATTPGIGEHVEGTWPHAQFHHLAMDGYAAAYYSYLYSHAFASQVWDDVLGGGAGVNRTGGDALRFGLLAAGGGADPGALLSRLLGKGAVRAGADGGVLPDVQRCVRAMR